MVETTDTKPAAKPAAKPTSAGKIAVILIRNVVRADVTVIDGLKNLKLLKKHVCVIVDKTPANLGMVKKVKDYVAFGDIDAATIKLLQEKRGIKDNEGNLKKYFHLNPPKGGFERKGIKRTFDQGGALGDRREKINDLIKKMV